MSGTFAAQAESLTPEARDVSGTGSGCGCGCGCECGCTSSGDGATTPAGATAGAASGTAGGACCDPPAPTTVATAGLSTPRGGYTIRSASPEDLPRVRDLLADAGLPADDLAPQFGGQYVVAESAAGALIGAEGIELYGTSPRYGLLRSAVVAEPWRGRGLGEALTRDRIEWARAHGVAEIYLLTTTAAEFFGRLGFAPVDRADAPNALKESSEFTTVCPSTAVTMRLKLAAETRPPALGLQPAALRAAVQERYGAAAARAAQGASAGCGTSCCGAGTDETWNPITSNLYDEAEAAGIPATALLASLGCGNPTALAQLNPGEVVLDLGSGGGIDVLLSAKRVGATGKAYGLDVTDEMLALAEENRRQAGATNVEFLKGEIEQIPLPDASVDVIISNCVINLSADKGRVLREAFRVLKPGGRFAVSDIVVRGQMPEALRRSVELWIGCVAGALEEREYERLLAQAGFVDAGIEPTRIYRAADARAFLAGAGLDPAQVEAADGMIMSAFVRATKPPR